MTDLPESRAKRLQARLSLASPSVCRPRSAGFTWRKDRTSAAFLFKAAARLGLDGAFGARHLTGHPDGRAQHWRDFTGALDALALAPDEEDRVIAGAKAAFVRVDALVDVHFA